MLQISDEPVLTEQSILEGSQQRFIKVNHSTTIPANKVMVMSLLHRVIPDTATAEVGCGYQAKLLEQVQGAIDGGDIDIGIFFYNLGMYFFGADVVITALNGR